MSNLAQRYSIKKISFDCYLIIDDWTGQSVYNTRTEHKAIEWQNFYNHNHHNHHDSRDEEYARSILNQDEFEEWLLRNDDESESA